MGINNFCGIGSTLKCAYGMFVAPNIISTWNLTTGHVRWRWCRIHVHFNSAVYTSCMCRKTKNSALTHDNNPGNDQSVTQNQKRNRKKFVRGAQAKPNLVQGRAGDETCTSIPCHDIAMPMPPRLCTFVHVCALFDSLRSPSFPCSFPGRKPKRRRGNPGSPLSGPNLVDLLTFNTQSVSTIQKFGTEGKLTKLWDKKVEFPVGLRINGQVEGIDITESLGPQCAKAFYLKISNNVRRSLQNELTKNPTNYKRFNFQTTTCRPPCASPLVRTSLQVYQGREFNLFRGGSCASGRPWRPRGITWRDILTSAGIQLLHVTRTKKSGETEPSPCVQILCRGSDVEVPNKLSWGTVAVETGHCKVLRQQQ